MDLPTVTSCKKLLLPRCHDAAWNLKPMNKVGDVKVVIVLMICDGNDALYVRMPQHGLFQATLDNPVLRCRILHII